MFPGSDPSVQLGEAHCRRRVAFDTPPETSNQKVRDGVGREGEGGLGMARALLGDFAHGPLSLK